MTSNNRQRTCLIVFALAGLWSPPSYAQEEVEQLYLEGAALYKDGKYRPAIEKFEKAYELYPEPNLLYNIGRAYEALGEIDDALKAFQRCVAADKTAPDVRDKAKAKIEQLERAKMRSKLTTVPPPPASPPPTPSPKTAPAAARPLKVTGSKGPSKAWKISAWTSAALALGFLGGGAAVFALGGSDHGKVDDASSAAGGGVASLTQLEAQELIDSGDRKKMIGGILLGVGGAAAAAATTFFILDAGQAPSVDVSVSGAGASVMIQGRF